MPRVPRYFIISDDAQFHITWQCHNKSWFLRSESSKQLYYNLLLKYKSQYNVKIYSYSFMSSHPHLTGYCSTQKGLSDFMRVVNSIFAQHINRVEKRCGQAIRDRFKSPQIQDDEHLFKVMMYVDLNPVRAKMVRHPGNYKWTSYHYYAHGTPDPLIDPAPIYLMLGATPKERQEAYRRHVQKYLQEEGLIKHNYSCVHAIGNPEWVLPRQQIIEAYLKEYRERYAEQKKGDP